ncbi:MAG: T9SS type A sorting domain-containing protein [Bacteroidia bacterium]
MKKEKIISIIVVAFFCFSAKAQQINILPENFTNYVGTAASLPTGWTNTANASYTSAGYSGTSGPNSYKFAATGSLTTPKFSNADSLQFWVKRGSTSDVTSKLIITKSSDNIIWQAFQTISPIPATASTLKFSIDTGAHYLKFSYTKATGNLAFDDFLLKGLAPVSAIFIAIQPTVNSITDNSANINWTTNIAGTSNIHYGFSSNALINTEIGANGITNHNVGISALTANTMYYFRVFSTAGNTDSSDILSFTTANSSITKVEENSLAKNIFSVFPNPAKEQLTLQLNTPSKNYFFDVYNSAGQKMLSGSFFSNSTSKKIDVRNWKKGLYLLIFRDDKTQYIQKFIKD